MVGKDKGTSRRLWWDFRYIWMFISTIWVFFLLGGILSVWRSRWIPDADGIGFTEVSTHLWVRIVATVLVLSFIAIYVEAMYRMYFGRSSWISNASERERWMIRLPLIVIAGVLVILPVDGNFSGNPFPMVMMFVVIGWTITSPPAKAFSAVIISTILTTLILAVPVGGGEAFGIAIYSLAFGFFTSGYVINRGLINELRLEQSRVADRAVTEERFRLARDLHDTVGHSMTQITLKAELARKLVAANDPGRAEAELADIESLSRELSAQVRQSIAGEVELTFDQDLDRAETLLDSMNISLDKTIQVEQLPAHVDAALAWCTREGVMNIIKHSGASDCRIRLQKAGGDFVLEISDNGNHSEPTATSGQGIIGMQSRLQSLGGSVTFVRGSDGHNLEVRIPV